MKVLVVDGSSEASHIVEVLSGVDNVAVSGTVPDIASASRTLDECVPDILVTSSALPDGDGHAVIDRARRCAPVPAIIVVDDAPSREQWLRHLGAGADRVVARDAELRELRDVVAAIASTGAANDEADPFRLIGRLGAGVAHDLNNYLNVIGSALDLHATRGHGLAEAREALDRAQRLTRTLVDYVRGREQARAAIDLGELVRGVADIVASSVGTVATIHLDVSARTRPIYGVKTELEQLVLNLIVNASDAMRPAGGRIFVAVKPTGTAAVLLEVADEGAGLDPHALDTVRGVRSTPARTAGLGLAIVRDVADRHGAVVRVTNGPQRGTIVRIAFPALTTPNAPC